MKTRKQVKSIVNKVVSLSFKDGKLNEKKVVDVIKLFKIQPRVEAIWLLSEYSKKLKLMLDSKTMMVESVIPLSQKELSKLRKKFSSQYEIFNTEFKLSPSLLGGLKVKIGDYIFEDSIISRINQLGRAIRS